MVLVSYKPTIFSCTMVFLRHSYEGGKAKAQSVVSTISWRKFVLAR